MITVKFVLLIKKSFFIIRGEFIRSRQNFSLLTAWTLGSDGGKGSPRAWTVMEEGKIGCVSCRVSFSAKMFKSRRSKRGILLSPSNKVHKKHGCR